MAGTSTPGIDVNSAVSSALYADRAPERQWQADQVTLTSQTTALTAKIGNLYQGDIQLPVVSKTLTVGPMDIDGVPHS